MAIPYRNLQIVRYSQSHAVTPMFGCALMRSAFVLLYYIIEF